MPRVEFVQERNADGTVVLRAVVVGPVERLRRLVRELATRPPRRREVSSVPLSGG